MNNWSGSMSKLPLYFDNMATSPVDPRVIEKMVQYLGPHGVFGNPASTTHVYGKMAARAVENAREQIAAVVGASPDEIIFTSGATEANNLAIIGTCLFYQRKGRHIVTVKTEHKSVLDAFEHLEKLGFEVSYLTPQADGLLEPSQLENALRPDTIFVSIMHVNNEIGVIQDIQVLGDLLRDKGIIFHVDAAQSVGKLEIDLKQLGVDLMSFSGHKNYGPKGIGALFVRQRPRIRLYSQSYGGAQEKGLRAGTLPTHQIVGLGEALSLSDSIKEKEQIEILSLRQMLWDGIKELPNVHLNGHEKNRIAGNLNITFRGLEGESILLALHELAISTTSACASGSLQPSYVLKALGLSDELAYSSVRISLGRFTTEKEVQEAIRIIQYQITRLHEISPS